MNASVTKVTGTCFACFPCGENWKRQPCCARTGMSPPTFSRCLKDLERCVAAPLFFQASSGVKLTRHSGDLQRLAGDMTTVFELFQHDLRSEVGQ